MTQKSQHRKAPKESHIWVRNQIIVGIILSIGMCLGAYHFLPIQISDIKSPADRLVLAVRCIFISTIPVFALFKSVADTRFFTRAIDPVKGGGEDMVDVPNRILRNTTEQFLLHAVGLLTLSTFLDEASLKILPILSCDFVIFRMLFWWGYLNAPLNRAVGMSGTASTTICVYAYCMYCILKPVFISFFG